LLDLLQPYIFCCRHYFSHIHENFCSPLNHQLKPLSASKVGSSYM
jgi:hypothetical protein